MNMKDKIPGRRYRALLTFATVTLLIAVAAAVTAGEVKYRSEYTYEFRDKETFEKCEHLLKDRHEGYILYGTYEENGCHVAYVRELIDDDDTKQKISFESRRGLAKFVNEETISVYEDIPTLNFDATFSDNGGKGPYTVSYRLKYHWPQDVLSYASGPLTWLLVIWALLNLAVIGRYANQASRPDQA